MENRESESDRSPDNPRNLACSTLQRLDRLDVQPGPLLTLLEAPPDNPERVTQALMQSSTLSARVLSVTNSAAIGVVGEISDIRRAVLHMGAGRARSIAMAFGLHMLSKDSGIDLEVAHRIWINSLEKAHLAKLVAEAVDPREADRAYTLGLIQDIGLTALVAIDPQFYEQVSVNHRHQNPLSIREQEHFGIDHAQAANHLLQSWNASPLICEEVLNHHQPLLSQNDYSGSNLGNLIAGMLPHNCETMTPDRMEWLTATHSQFLDTMFDSPEQMIKQAVKQAREVHGAAPSVRIDEATRQRMLYELEVDTASMVHQLCELEAQLTRKHEQLHALQFEAMTDPLTQVLNRRGFNRLGERRIHTATERCLPICAVMIDLDGFKAINDTLGHDAGDIMLIEVAKQIRNNIDSSDLFGRLGGDEFAILQLNVDEETARNIIERVAAACNGKTVHLGQNRQATLRLSIGATICNNPGKQTLINDLIAAADEAMYISKRAANGQVTFTQYPSMSKAS